MKILLRTALSRYSGYGNDGIGLAQALVRRGHDVYLQTTGVDAPLPEDVAQLFTKELRAPFDLYLNHADPMALKLEDEAQKLADVNVAWTMWEYTSLDNMAYTPRRSLRKRLKNFDLLVGYSDVDPGCFQPYFKGPIAVRQGGFDPDAWPEMERDWNSDDFYFCMIGVLSSRKAPFAAIEAFSQLQREHEDFLQHARLSLKTNAPGLHSGIEKAFPGIRIYYDTWPVDTVRHFYGDHHVLLSPSRGEGKNMPALEFQATGGVVIATNFAGHKQWLHPSYNYAVDYTLEPADIYKPGAKNATVDIDDLKAKMLHVFRNRGEARTKGHIAADVIPKIASWDRAVEDLFLRIKETVPEKGERTWMLDQITQREASREHVR